MSFLFHDGFLFLTRLGFAAGFTVDGVVAGVVGGAGAMVGETVAGGVAVRWVAPDRVGAPIVAASAKESRLIVAR